MRRPSPLPHALAAAPFGVAGARELGLTPARLRAGDLARPHRGVRVAVAVTDIAGMARAYEPLVLPGQFFSHTTAAVLLGLRLPEGLRETVIHVSSVAPSRAPRGRRVAGHQVAASPRLVRVGSLLVCDPIATWVSLAATLSIDQLVVMGDGLVRRDRPLATLAQLRDAVAAHSGKRGYRKLVRALELVRPGTDSARETLLRLVVVRAGFPEPEVNGPIDNSFGALIAHGDLVFRLYRTILEYDGGQHREDERQYFIDIDRLDALMEERWRVIRVDKNLFARRATLLGKIDRALRDGGWGG